MAIVPQHATATADGTGDAIFSFPDVAQGELWCGTTTVPGAPSTAVGMVTIGGELVGAFYGPGSYGPWTCDYSQKLVLSVTGLTPGQQYQAIWHADSKGGEFSTYPAPITPTVVTGGGTVVVTNFPAVQTVDGTVTAKPELATAVESGQVTMTGFVDTLPAFAAVQGVVLTAPASNAHPIYVGNATVSAGSGMILSPGQDPTPILPVSNSDVLSAIGTAPDVLSFLVI